MFWPNFPEWERTTWICAVASQERIWHTPQHRTQKNNIPNVASAVVNKSASVVEHHPEPFIIAVAALVTRSRVNLHTVPTAFRVSFL